MTTTTSHVMTWAAFEQLPSGDGFHREMIEGELQVLPPPKSFHSKIAKTAFKKLLELESLAQGQAYLEAGYKLATDPPTWVQPDASFLANERDRATGRENYFEGAPDLAIEVVSPSESARDLRKKVRLMLSSGSLIVLVIYPNEQIVEVHRPDGTSVTLKPGDTLTIPELAKDWSVPVADLFAD